MADALAGHGANVVAGDWVVNRVRAVKTPAELERVRRASQIADDAFLQVLDEIRPGMTELQVSARVDLAMAERGGEPPAIRTMISAGPEVWCRTHGAPGRRPVERGDIMYFDTSGVVDRYHVDLCRTISVGADHEEVRGILDVTRGSVDAVIEAVKPGDPLDVAQRVAEDYVFSRFPRENVWWVGGYALGHRPAARLGRPHLPLERRLRAVHVGARLRHELREHPLQPRPALHGVVHGDAADDRDRHRGALAGATDAPRRALRILSHPSVGS